MKLHTAILAWLFFGAIGTLAAVLAVLNLVRGEYLTAVVALGGCAFCYGLIFPLAKVVRGKQAPNVEVDDAGTTFRPARGIDIPVRISLLGLVAVSALISVLVPSGAMTPEGTALRELVRFYWQHPESRGELSDGGALKRLADAPS
jgi:hypothetical protein